MPALVLINGAPGSGKSTMASALVTEWPMALAVDVDVLKHRLGGWQADAHASGLQARRLAIALIRQHLADGHDVVVGQYLARTPFIEELQQVATAADGRFVEIVLVMDAAALARRLAARVDRPDRPEQLVNNALVGPGHATELVESMEALLAQRPHAVRVDASGSQEQTLEQLRAVLSERRQSEA